MATSEKDFWDKLRAAATSISLIAIPILVAWFGSSIERTNKEADVRLQTVEMAIGILQSPPEESTESSLRGWAIDVVNSYSGIEITDEARQELLINPLPRLAQNIYGFVDPAGLFPNAPPNIGSPPVESFSLSLGEEESINGDLVIRLDSLSDQEVTISYSNNKLPAGKSPLNMILVESVSYILPASDLSLSATNIDIPNDRVDFELISEMYLQTLRDMAMTPIRAIR